MNVPQRDRLSAAAVILLVLGIVLALAALVVAGFGSFHIWTDQWP